MSVQRLGWDVAVTPTKIALIAQAFLDRAEVAGWDEKQKHIAALEYFMGAYVCARARGHDTLASELLTATSMMTYVNGYKEAERLVAR